jgi:hypothetical protein
VAVQGVTVTLERTRRALAIVDRNERHYRLTERLSRVGRLGPSHRNTPAPARTLNSATPDAPRASGRKARSRRDRTRTLARSPGRQQDDDPPAARTPPPGGPRKPNLHDVLAAITRGRVTYLTFTAQQKRHFRDRDARIALDVVRHLLGARTAAANGRLPASFPLTEAVFQTVAQKLGHGHIGIKRCRVLLRRLVANKVINPAGSYRQRYRITDVSGYRVPVFRLTGVAAPLKGQRPIGRKGRVKVRFQPRWWAHPLFGDMSGRPPPHIGRRRANRMRSLDEIETPWRYGLAFN